MKYVSCPRLQVPSHPAAAGSSEVRVTGSAPECQGLRVRPGSAAARAPRPARVTPGLSSQSWFTRVICLNMGGAGDEALNSWRLKTGLVTLTPGSRPVIGVTWPLYFEETKYG